jgi:hypothetical protein
MNKWDMKAAFRAGWYADPDHYTLDELFEKWYDDYTASRKPAGLDKDSHYMLRRKGW